MNNNFSNYKDSSSLKNISKYFLVKLTFKERPDSFWTISSNDIKVSVKQNIPFARVVVKNMISVEPIIDDSRAKTVDIDVSKLGEFNEHFK